MIPELSLFFFSADSTERETYKYQLLLESARFADENGFTAVWTPERHFQRFGGLYGSPSVTGAALAVTTKRISIRAGSIVLPLQNPLRVAEEWAMIDNLSGGRVAIAAASGWHVNDFVLSPDTYNNRYEDMYDKISVIQRLWHGDKIPLANGAGVMCDVGILPAPIQKELPIWITGQSDDSFVNAGKLGFNVLTANFALKHSLSDFIRKTQLYRDAIQTHHGRRGHVTLMAHTFAAEDHDEIKALARPAMAAYLKLNVDMQKDHSVGSKQHAGFSQVSEREREILVRNQVNNDLHGPLSFVGTLDQCSQQAECLNKSGVDEIACLIDFGIGFESVMGSLKRLATLIAH
ncbi:MAG TPA: MupA/Atu3671 family FMN-dependent luciferase-like monooxygenase [Pseudacidobacterium sp.]|jgi:natural product biosynthesis luciferase-like monooxygenase protein|nr:MupA/Atu3671 family FMN-dependent luciferase-like monooxygenase [Pseudacidobacterium sp.]